MKALGITSMIIAIIAIFIPIIGVYLTVICAILAAIAAGPGLTYGVVAILVNTINLVFMSPSLWLTEVAAASATGEFAGMGAVLIGVQVVALVILIALNMYLKKKKTA